MPEGEEEEVDGKTHLTHTPSLHTMATLPKMYRALQLRQPGGISEFEMVQRALRPPTNNEILMKVKACAVAYRDVLDRQGAFKFIKRPSVLGHEFSGEVVALGPSATGQWAVGDKVVSFHWDQTQAWPSPLTAGSAVQTMFGLTCDGGYAEYAIVWPGSLGRAPQNMPLEDAACVASTFGTVWHASIDKCQVAAGQRVLVTGASGGVGSAAVKLFRALGCHVTGVTTSEKKAAFLQQVLGCDDVVVTPDGRFRVREPVDHVLEAVGGPTFSSSLRAIRPGGSIALIGNVENSTVPLPLGYCILNSVRIVGSDSIPQQQFNSDLVSFMERHNLRPTVDERVPLEHVPNVHQRLEQRGVVGRVIALL